MDKYIVSIYETLATNIEVEAEDYSDAIKKVREKYNNEEIILSADDYLDTEFDCIKVNFEKQ